jgi:thiol-disulfide isomerase/thioredoxin
MDSVRSNASSGKRFGLILLSLLIVFAVATFFLTRPMAVSSSLSPVSGLVTLKETARQSVPFEEAVANGKPTFLEFYADWCTTCQSMAADVAELHQHYGKSVNFVMLNIDDPQWRSQVESFRVGGVPEYYLLDADQSVQQSFIGRVPYSIMAQAVSYLIP